MHHIRPAPAGRSLPTARSLPTTRRRPSPPAARAAAPTADRDDAPAADAGPGSAFSACTRPIESAADSGPGTVADAGSSADREDADAGMGHLAGGRRRREPQATTRPMPALIPPSSAPQLNDFDAALGRHTSKWNIDRPSPDLGSPPSPQGRVKVGNARSDLRRWSTLA